MSRLSLFLERSLASSFWVLIGDGRADRTPLPGTFAVLLCICLSLFAGFPCTSSAQEAKQTSAATVSTNYVLKPNDEISIRVFREPDLDGPRRISKDGTIDFPLLGIVSVSGKTQYEAAAHLAALLDKDYLVRPQVFVTVTAATKRFYNVLGQVGAPGRKEIPEDRELDILSAIAAAGGFTRIADESAVIVHRNDQTYKVNIKQMSSGKDTKPFIVQPNDTIWVKESLF